MSIRIAIVEDYGDIRESLRVLIQGTEGLECTGSFACMEDALREANESTADVWLLDIGLPGMSGIEGLRALRLKCPEVVVLMLTVFEDDERVFDALCAGATGYLLKRTPPARLLEAIEEAVRGGAPMSPEIARKVVTLFRKFSPPSRSDHTLTPHEARLLGLLVKGHSYKTAAHELGVSVHTVSFHLRSIYSKLEVHSKSEAVSKALRERMLW